MKKQFLILSIISLFILLSFTAFSQNYSEQAKTYFGKYLDSKAMENLFLESLPTVDDCKLVFTGQNAYTYFGYIADMKSKPNTEKQKEPEKFVDLKIESFTTSDIEQDKGNYAGGMKTILDKLQTGVTFYKVDLLREKGAEFGVAHKYWVKIESRWVFFPKPWAAFEK
jgi:hypothetical protein